MDIDVQKEWRELLETYSQMADQELQSLAAEGYELTDLAKQALQSQLKARGLKADLVETPPVSEAFDEGDQRDQRGNVDPSELDLIDVMRAWDANEARTLKSALDKGGVPSFIGPNNLDSVDDYHGSFENGIPIRVRESDQQRAARALAPMFSAVPKDTSAEDDYQARCPKCHSDEIVFLELDRSSSPPDAEPKFHWHCDACGNDWEDDGVEEN
jgi:hypothetical protein